MKSIDAKHPSLKRSMLYRLLAQLAIFSVALLALVFFLDVVLNGVTGRLLELIFSGETAELLIRNQGTLVWMFYLAGVMAIACLNFSRMAGLLDALTGGLDALLDLGAPPPVLPDELRPAEDRLRQVRETVAGKEREARQAEQRKNDLVVYLAHDLKTPLTSVVGYLSLLEETPDLPARQRAKYTGIALEKALRLEQLINEFFDITRFNLQSVSLERGRVDLSMLLSQMADEFYPILAARGLSIALDAAPGLELTGDADKLARVFDNLLRNAAAYSYENTAMTLSAEREEGEAVVRLRNVGPEIPPDKLGRIFEKFFRLDAARASRTGGAGLGLAIAKQIIELHGGGIEASSSPEYTEFVIRLPLRL